MIEWFSAASSAVAAGVVIWQFQRSAKFKDDVIKRFNELDVKLAGQFVSSAKCKDEQIKCHDYLKETIKDPICRKIDEIRTARKEAWEQNGKTQTDLWQRVNKHTHEGLDPGARVIIES